MYPPLLQAEDMLESAMTYSLFEYARDNGRDLITVDAPSASPNDSPPLPQVSHMIVTAVTTSHTGGEPPSKQDDQGEKRGAQQSS